MPMGKSRLQRIRSDPDSQPAIEGSGQFMTDAGKRTGGFVKGMFSFYGNAVDGAKRRIQDKKSQVQEPPFG